MIPLLFLASFLFVQEKRVFVFQSNDQIIQFIEIRLELSEFEEIILKMRYEDILLIIFMLGCMMGLNSCFTVIKVFAVHPIFFIIKIYTFYFLPTQKNNFQNCINFPSFSIAVVLDTLVVEIILIILISPYINHKILLNC